MFVGDAPVILIFSKSARAVIEQHDESLQCRQDTTEQLIRSVSQAKEGGKAAFLL